MKNEISIFWFRRDLRLHDNHGLFQALSGEYPVLPLFIFDRNILDDLEDKKDARVMFIHDVLMDIKKDLRSSDGDILIKYGTPVEIWKELLESYNIRCVYTNRDYEPYAKDRDKEIKSLLESRDIEWQDFKDHVIFDRDEVVKDDGEPYVVFTPYSRKWKDALRSDDISNSKYFKPFKSENKLNNILKTEIEEFPSLEAIGFTRSDIEIPPKEVSQKLIKAYDKNRNYPARDGTSRLGIHFRFGTISIREKALKASKLNDTFLNELIWRDFYSQILSHFPKVVEESFRAKYDRIEWRNNEKEFELWCEGRTGFPMVDAGMRELNESGYMHNRVRMITASFLTKHLLIDWRWGEAYFAKKLLDYDLASNNGGWQWAAGSGTDAAPYFRIFNPTSQLKKFDPELEYVKQWVPEYGTDDYPDPMVDHKEARQRCLDTYKNALDNN